MNIEKGKQGKKAFHGEFERKTRWKAVSPICIHLEDTKQERYEAKHKYIKSIQTRKAASIEGKWHCKVYNSM